MDRLQNSFMSIEHVKDTYLNQANYNNVKENVDQKPEFDFKMALEKAGDKIYEDVNNKEALTFSKHANERLESRNISLSNEQLERLNKGVSQAKEKSINESLVMMDNLAFIVNVKNNTVITAMEQETKDSNVFTNIDGAVIV